MSSSTKLSFANINKTYPGVTALKDVNIELRAGEIHGLVGKNGAGKSTLVDIIYGWVRPDSGDAFIHNDRERERINFKNYSPKVAQNLGIYLVPQEPPFALDLTIEENFFMVSPIMKDNFRVNKKKMVSETKKTLQAYDLDYLEPNMLLADVSMEDRHLLYTALISDLRDSAVLLLDEVTAALRGEKIDVLFGHLNRIRGKKSVIYISHRVDEVINICDRVTVIRDGRKICTEKTSNLSEAELANLIVGAKVKVSSFSNNYYLDQKSGAATILEVKNLSSEKKFKDINFRIKAGEILGITGLVGSGVSKLFRTLGGLEAPTSGSIILEGEEVFFKQPKAAINKGIIYGTNERLKEAVLPTMSIMDNVNASIWERLTKKVFFDRKEEEHNFKEQTDKFNTKYSIPEANFHSLSGGNQQKAILARLNSTNPRVYILNCPTKGIDIGAKYEILKLLRTRLTNEGNVVILNTPSIVDLMLVADRIITLFEGRLQDMYLREDFNEVTIYKSIQGVDLDG